MAETSKAKVKRHRHFWQWVTNSKKLNRRSLIEDNVLSSKLRDEHSRLFPRLYSNMEAFKVKEYIREFHRKVITFKSTIEKDKNYEYEEGALDDIECFSGQITKEEEENFMKSYFCGYKNFVKNGAEGNHRNYQMHFIDSLYARSRKIAVRNKYAIKNINKLIQRKRVGKESFYSTKKGGEVNSKDTAGGVDTFIDTVPSVSTQPAKPQPACRVRTKEEKRLLREEKNRLLELKRETLRKRRKVDKEKAKILNKLRVESIQRVKKAIKQGKEETLNEEDKRLHAQMREDREVKHVVHKEGCISYAHDLLGSLTEDNVTNTKPHRLGKLGQIVCKRCKALLWKKENGYICCANEQFNAGNPSILMNPKIKALYDGSSPLSKRFLDNIVGFNLLFSFTSFSTSQKLENIAEKSMCYKIKGNVYHKLGKLNPIRVLKEGMCMDDLLTKNNVDDEAEELFKPKPSGIMFSDDGFLDMYFYHDRHQQLKLRSIRMNSSNRTKKKSTKKRNARTTKEIKENESIISLLYEYLIENNLPLKSLLKEFDNVKRLTTEYYKKHKRIPEMSITLKSAENVKTREHKGVYHLPSSTSQVGAIVNLDRMTGGLEITIRSHLPDSKYPLFRVGHHNFFYDCFQYPILIPHGDIGYSYSMAKKQRVIEDTIEGETKRKRYGRVTPCIFYSSLLMEREGTFNYITKGRMLFQQYVVDNYVKAETDRLNFLRHNQSTLRKERADVLKCDSGKSACKGQRIIIPPSFVGGPRYMKERQQDALSYVTHYGSPDFFITFTMNPKWEELEEAIGICGSKEVNSPQHRPDLVSRIFKLKVDTLMGDLTKKNIFGRVKAHLYSIEWQKRGLPHAHILLWMENIVNQALVATLIRAEIPDKDKEPRLFKVVTRSMIHGPCKGYDESNICCQGRGGTLHKCSKDFPKECRDTTLFGNNGYPLYQRKAIGSGGNSFVKRVGKKDVVVDNSWVVPYNPYLCLKYDAHINVECSNSIKCIAYVTKYVNKGCDRILFKKSEDEGQVDEIKNYQEARFVNANEATWKLFKFPIHKSFPPVIPLDLHLENENEVFYDERFSEEKILEKTNSATQLTAFFSECKRSAFASSLMYQEMPNHFTYDSKQGVWKERVTKSSALGRIRAVTSKTVELFYLRLLLTHKKGPTSFDDLRTVEGIKYTSFREAVKAMGLLNDEATWLSTIMEIINHTNCRKQLRTTYASMLVFSDLEDQSEIWKETRDLFSSDFLIKSGCRDYNDEIYTDALDDIQEKVWDCGGGSITEYGLPPSRNRERVSNMIRREKEYNRDALAEDVRTKYDLLNYNQRNCYDTIMAYINERKGDKNGFFIDAPGGTGKSFVLNLILDTVRSNGQIALATASSGIAATVLHGGKTAHNMFRIPIMEYNEIKACSIKKKSEVAKLILSTSVIIWDEVVMSNKNTIVSLDVSIRDITEKDTFMGGIPFVCAGDFRQILPVIRGGGKNEELYYCIKNSYFWKDLVKFELTENVRLKKDDVDNISFSKNLLLIGSELAGELDLPPKFGVKKPTKMAVIEEVYHGINSNKSNSCYFKRRSIVSPIDVCVDEVNDVVYNKLEGREVEYRSEDTAIEEESIEIQTSVYNSMKSPNLPPHLLKLKVGCVVMVVRNMNPPKVCNGTRLLVTNLRKNIVVGKILGGVCDGEQVIIPRITLSSTDTSVAFKRKQFPLKLSFCMTINKSQGQTFDKCGLLLDTSDCFSHGQFYVACSRVTNWDSLLICTGTRKINGESCDKPPYNVIYKELFMDTVNIKKDTVVETTGDFEKEDLEHGCSPFTDVHKLTEEEAIAMILPDYVPDNVYTHSFDDDFKEEVELILDKVQKEIKKEKKERKREMEEEKKERQKEIEEEKKERQKEIEEEKKERQKEIDKIKDVIKRISDEDDTDHTSSLRKRQTCSLDGDVILEPPVKKSKVYSDNKDK